MESQMTRYVSNLSSLHFLLKTHIRSGFEKKMERRKKQKLTLMRRKQKQGPDAHGGRRSHGEKGEFCLLTIAKDQMKGSGIFGQNPTVLFV
jgi:hypothetical protein